jgi:hypothetical protein
MLQPCRKRNRSALLGNQSFNNSRGGRSGDLLSMNEGAHAITHYARN